MLLLIKKLYEGFEENVKLTIPSTTQAQVHMLFNVTIMEIKTRQSPTTPTKKKTVKMALSSLKHTHNF